MANARAKLIEVAALNRAKGIGDAMKFDILGRVAADRRQRALGVTVIAFETGAVTLAPAAGKPNAGLPARPAAEEAHRGHVETDPQYVAEAHEVIINKLEPRSEEHTYEIKSIM